jgi:hypothetical protein
MFQYPDLRIFFAIRTITKLPAKHKWRSPLNPLPEAGGKPLESAGDCRYRTIGTRRHRNDQKGSGICRNSGDAACGGQKNGGDFPWAHK